MSNSPLVSYTKISPNRTKNRTHAIDTITIHCVVGQCSVESLGSHFSNPKLSASSNYGIGKDGRIGMYVEEKDRSWCSSSSANDNRAITIECASDLKHPYAINDTVYASLIELCADICKRNNIKELKWKNDKSLIGQPDKQNLTIHRWFAATSCPGQYIYERLGQIAEDVNAKLNGTTKPSNDAKPETAPTPPTPQKSIDEIAREVINGKWGSGADRKNRLTKAGYDYAAVQKRVNEILSSNKKTETAPTTPQKSIDELAREVINGKWGSGSTRKKRLTEAGHDYAAVQKRVNEILSGDKKTETTPQKSIDELAREVINGKWGSGSDRKKRLTEAGYDYAAVQKRVNELLR